MSEKNDLLTISKARKVLGQLASNMSDRQVLESIILASMLKDMFFKSYQSE